MTTDSEIRVQGVKVRYRDSRTNGPVVLLSHGIGCMLEIFEPTFAALASQYRVISWDFPGFGRSEIRSKPYTVPVFAEAGFAFLDALGIEKAHLVGHSMGGGVSLVMARTNPSRVQSLILAGAATMGRSCPFIFRLFVLPGIGKVLSAPTRSGAKQALKSMFVDYARVPEGLEEIWHQCSARPGRQQFFLDVLKSMTTFTGGQRRELVEANLAAMPSLTMPVLLIQGREDTAIAAQHSIAAAELIPGAQLEIIPSCGHFPQLEKAEEFNQALGAFLARHA